MKKLSLLIAILSIAISTNAQNISDVTTFGTENIQGSARFQAMSGAFGALGGDLSAININPAASAVFNNHFMTISVSSFTSENLTNYGGIGSPINNRVTDFDINQLGGVMVLKNKNENDEWRKISLAFNYNVVNNFENDFLARGNSNLSIDEYFLNYAQGVPLGIISLQGNETRADAYLDIGSNVDFGAQQAFLGFQAFIIDPADNEDDENTIYLPASDFSSVNQRYFSSTTGYNSKFNLNMAAQYGDNLYLGASLNFNAIDKETYTQFDEDGYSATSELQDVEFDNLLRTYGSAFSFSLGAITKIDDMLRVGASYQSPTWYLLNDELSQRIATNLSNPNLADINFSIVNAYPEYTIQIPGKITASAALIFGQQGLLSFDYGYQDMTAAKLKPTTDADFAFENERIRNLLKPVSTYRIGAEYRVDQLSLRAGYRFEESPYNDGTMIGDLNGFSLGAGYSFGATKVDLSFNQSQRDIGHQLYNTGLTNTAEIDNKNTSVILSVSFNL